MGREFSSVSCCDMIPPGISLGETHSLSEAVRAEAEIPCSPCTAAQTLDSNKPRGREDNERKAGVQRLQDTRVDPQADHVG